MATRSLRWFASATIAAVMAAHATSAEACRIDVRETATGFGPPNGVCGLYEALNVAFGFSDPDCSCVTDPQFPNVTIRLLVSNGTYLIQEGISISGFAVVGLGVGSTTLRTDGFPNPTAVVMNGGMLSNLTVRGQNLVGPTLGVYFGEGEATLDHVRVTGFNNSGIQTGTFDDNGTPNDPNDDFVVEGFPTIIASRIDGNSAPARGGGLLQSAGVTTLHGSTISGNTAPHGGGIDVRYGQVFADYSTIASNRATAGVGGGVHAEDSDVNFAEFNAYHVTIAFNSASQTSGGGGVFVGATSVFVSNKVNASIIARNTSGNNNVQDDYRGRLRSDNLGFQDGRNANLLGTLSNPPPAGYQGGFDIVSANPGLASGLANNGGPTQTVALNAGSPAINASQNPVTLPGVPGRNYDTQFHADQRGVSLPRPSPNQRYDLGSYER